MQRHNLPAQPEEQACPALKTIVRPAGTDPKWREISIALQKMGCPWQMRYPLRRLWTLGVSCNGRIPKFRRRRLLRKSGLAGDRRTTVLVDLGQVEP
jgi:hypothetical protein